MRQTWCAALAAGFIALLTPAARAASTSFALTGAWTKVAAAGSTVDVQNVGGGSAVLTTSGTPPSAGAPGVALSGNGDHRLMTLGTDLYANSVAGATVVVTDNVGTGSTVSIGAPASSCDATLTSGGAAQSLCGGVTPTNGWAVYNPNLSDDLWCSDSATAAINGAGSIRIVANGGGYETPAGYRPAGPITCVGPTAGDKVTGRRW